MILDTHRHVALPLGGASTNRSVPDRLRSNDHRTVRAGTTSPEVRVNRGDGVEPNQPGQVTADSATAAKTTTQ
jgi:hypothetical protein